MAIVGLSLVLASVVYIAIRRPPFIETLLALWRGDPKIQQPPTTRSPPSPEITVADDDDDQPTTNSSGQTVAPSFSISTPESDRAAMPPPPPVIQRPNGSAKSPSSHGSPSPQTTPKASATRANGNVPSFSLSASPPASAASVARTSDATSTSTTPHALPSLSASRRRPSVTVPSPSLSTPTSTTTTSMAPPPRPPTLNNINNSSLLSAPPMRPSPLPNRQQHDRQPGTSTLAPPPTHSSKPTKPSRKVTLTPGHSPLDWARLANHPTADLRGVGAGTPYLRVTPSMLKAQTGRRGKDAWTALGGRVYNISPYLPYHPGGEPELLRAAGRDGTRLFGEIHPWVNYETMLASCLVGLLVEEGEARSSGEMEAMD
ncbi:hypothetical protein F5B20DRAFT_550708 [Whalleya microplaca]|nr:hypothetical protein F5B20DRAFT_550708 [Whalleya microplaca]